MRPPDQVDRSPGTRRPLWALRAAQRLRIWEPTTSHRAPQGDGWGGDRPQRGPDQLAPSRQGLGLGHLGTPMPSQAGVGARWPPQTEGLLSPLARQGNLQTHPERRNPLPQGFLKQLASSKIIFPSDGPSGRNNTLAVPRRGKKLIRESPPPPPPAPRLLKALVDSSASQHCPWSQRLSEKRRQPLAGNSGFVPCVEGWAGGCPAAWQLCKSPSESAPCPSVPATSLLHQGLSWLFRSAAPPAPKAPHAHSHPR